MYIKYLIVILASLLRLCFYELAFLDKFATLGKVTISFIMSVCPSFRPQRTTRLLLNGFPWNLIFEHFSKICRENSTFIKI